MAAGKDVVAVNAGRDVKALIAGMTLAARSVERSAGAKDAVVLVKDMAAAAFASSCIVRAMLP